MQIGKEVARTRVRRIESLIMWRRLTAVTVLVLVATSGGAIAEPPPGFDVESVISVDEGNADQRRAELVADIWPAGTPSGRPVVDQLTFWPSKLTGLTQRPPVATMVSTVSNLTSLGFLLTPTTPPSKWAIVHQGHLPHDTSRYLEAGVGPTVDALVAAGWGVAVLQMPMQGWNADHTGDGFSVSSSIQGTANHKAMWQQTGGNQAPMLRFYLDPVIEVLNEIEARGAEQIMMTGISGGGWTTTLAAAVDRRIDVSVPVSGTLPLFARPYSPGSVTTDPEQIYPDSIMGDANGGYLDLYLLAATDDREQVQVINQYDPCCFGGDAHLMYSGALHELDPSWSVHVDTTHQMHQISPAVIESVILPTGVSAETVPPPPTTSVACP